MNRKWLLIALTIMLVVIPVFVACSSTSSTSKSTSTSPTTTAVPSTQANWWDKLGTPEYGGTLVVRSSHPIETANVDPSQFSGYPDMVWLEQLFQTDWLTDRSMWSFQLGFCPPEYYAGLLAQSWEVTDSQTVTVYLKQGVKWQDKPPANGREFTSDDVVFNFDRLLGTGSGFTEPNPAFAGTMADIEQVTAVDKYTVQFKLKGTTVFQINQVLAGGGQNPSFVPPESVQQGLLNDWKNAIGTGPFILTDVVPGVSETCDRNSQYWGFDERYPKNKLPYIDTYKEISIPDTATALASIRTGKIDIIADFRGGLSIAQGIALSESNPDIQIFWQPTPGSSIDLRCDKKPFTDIRVRQALQMSINRKSIAQSHYFGIVDGTPAGLVSPLYTGWVTPYEQWPTDLQQIYSYNPDQAKKLLADAGYSEGFNTNVIASSEDDQELLLIIKSQFMDINVNMEIQTFPDMPTFMNYAMSGKQDLMTYTSVCGHFMSPDQTIVRRTSGNRENYTYNNDPIVNAFLSQMNAASTLDDLKKAVNEADMYALEQCWAVNVFPIMTPYAVQSWVKNYSGDSISLRTSGFLPARLWIDQNLKGGK